MEITFEEMYAVHNNIMAIAHKELIKAGFTKQAQEMQTIAQSESGSIILHNLIKTTIDLMELDQITEPSKNE